MDLNQDLNLSDNNKSDNYSKLIDKVFSCVNDHLMILFNQMLSSADDKLFDLAEKSKSNEEQMQYMISMDIFF